jgi:hypothetical protein
MIGKTFIEIADLTVQLITNCIHSVTIPDNDNIIIDIETITEWLTTISTSDYDQIKNKVDDISESEMNTTANAVCQECGHAWETKIDLDISNFFEG